MDVHIRAAARAGNPSCYAGGLQETGITDSGLQGVQPFFNSPRLRDGCQATVLPPRCARAWTQRRVSVDPAFQRTLLAGGPTPTTSFRRLSLESSASCSLSREVAGVANRACGGTNWLPSPAASTSTALLSGEARHEHKANRGLGTEVTRYFVSREPRSRSWKPPLGVGAAGPHASAPCCVEGRTIQTCPTCTVPSTGCNHHPALEEWVPARSSTCA
eukprot:365968-Chlamydomonas_euryale.AAC.7